MKAYCRHLIGQRGKDKFEVTQLFKDLFVGNGGKAVRSQNQREKTADVGTVSQHLSCSGISLQEETQGANF